MKLILICAALAVVGCAETSAVRQARVVEEGKAMCRKAGADENHPKWTDCVMLAAGFAMQDARQADAEAANRQAMGAAFLAGGVSSYGSAIASQPVPQYQAPLAIRCVPAGLGTNCTSY